MTRGVWTIVGGLVIAAVARLAAHDPGAPPPTWNREISRVVYDRCASCHRQGGTAFSLMTYQEAQPRAVAIKATVLARQMPPWGAVKGFGDFLNDDGLTQEQISLITDWVEGGSPRGNNPNVMPSAPKFENAAPYVPPPHLLAVSGDFMLGKAVTLAGLIPDHVPDGGTMQIVAVMPDGGIEPLVWLYEYRDKYRHPFFFRARLNLPAGTVIRGVPKNAKISLIPAAGD